MIDETSVDVLAFACVAFEFPDSAGGGQPLFGAFTARLRLMMKDSWPKCAKFSSASLPLFTGSSANFLLALRL